MRDFLTLAALVVSFSLVSQAQNPPVMPQEILNQADVDEGDKSLETYDATMFSQDPYGAKTYGADTIIVINGAKYIKDIEDDLPDTYPCDFKTSIGVDGGLKALANVKDFRPRPTNPIRLTDGVYKTMVNLNNAGQIWMIISRTTQNGDPDCNVNAFKIFLKNGSLLNIKYDLPFD